MATAGPSATPSIKSFAVHIVESIDQLQSIITAGGDPEAWFLEEGGWMGADATGYPTTNGVLRDWMTVMVAGLETLRDGGDMGPPLQRIFAMRAPLAALTQGVAGTPRPTPTPAPKPKPIVVKGKGSQNTKPFAVPAGDYTVTIAGSGHSNVIAELVPRGGSFLDSESLFNEISNGKYKYETVVYDLDGGSYYLDVTNQNAWVVTLTPLQ